MNIDNRLELCRDHFYPRSKGLGCFLSCGLRNIYHSSIIALWMIVGGYIFFQGKCVEHRIRISVLLIVFIAGSFLYVYTGNC